MHQDQGSIYVRINLIKNSMILLKDHYYMGVGAGNAEYHIEHYGRYYTGGITNPHNWWIELLVNYGIFLFVAYIVFYMSIFKNLWIIQKHANSIWDKTHAEIGLVGMVVFILASISSSSIMAFHPQWVFWAYILGFINCYRLRDDEVEEL